MALKQCDKCNEMVDEAKAFCPACGNAFVEEERRSVSTNFEEMDMTVQLGQTMYNQMLSDMGLNVSKAPDVQEKVVEVEAITPAAVPLQPIAPAAPTKTVAPAQHIPAQSNNKWIWIIAGVIAAIILLGIIVVILAAAFVFYLAPRAT